MTELKLDNNIYDDMMKAVTETREKMLEEASEHYGIPKDELERQINEIGEEVQSQHPDAFPIIP